MGSVTVLAGEFDAALEDGGAAGADAVVGDVGVEADGGVVGTLGDAGLMLVTEAEVEGEVRGDAVVILDVGGVVLDVSVQICGLDDGTAGWETEDEGCCVGAGGGGLGSIG